MNKTIAKITNKRDTKFSSRKSIKKVETDLKNKSPPKHLYDNLQIIDEV